MTSFLKGHPMFLVILLLIWTLPFVSCGTANNSSGSPSASPTIQRATATTALPSPTATAVRKWTKVQTFTDTGNKITEAFDVSNDWKISWSCKGFSNPSVPGMLIVTMYYANGTSGHPEIINTACPPEGLSDYMEMPGAGSIYLNISFTGSSWTIQIQELK